MKKEKLRLIRELAKAKNFVLLTDKESVISLPNIDLNKLDDIQLLAHHQSALSRFSDIVAKAARDYEKKLIRITEAGQSKPKKVTKIPVKKG